MMDIEGDVTVRGTTADVDLSFGDILEDLDFAFQLHSEAWRGDWRFALDGTYVSLESDGDVGAVSVEVDTEIVLFEGGAYRRFVAKQLDEERSEQIFGVIGFRYTYLKTEIDFVGVGDVEGSEDWLDLKVGGRYTRDLKDNLALVVEGDIGGFGIGGSSDFAWNLQVLLGWAFGKKGNKRAWFGYRVLDYDYERGSFGFDATLHGPMLGLAFAL